VGVGGRRYDYRSGLASQRVTSIQEISFLKLRVRKKGGKVSLGLQGTRASISEKKKKKKHFSQ